MTDLCFAEERNEWRVCLGKLQLWVLLKLSDDTGMGKSMLGRSTKRWMLAVVRRIHSEELH
jgi:hypothetical protein